MRFPSSLINSNKITIFVMSQEVFILWLPLFLLMGILLYRVVFLYVIRTKIQHHAKVVYMATLRFLGDHKYEILTLRNAFYEGVIKDKRVYKAYLSELEEYVKGKDTELDKSLHYLHNVSL